MGTMTRHNTLRGQIQELRRLRSSANGNPRFEVTILLEDGTTRVLKTQPDASWSYEAENSDNRGVDLDFTLTSNGAQIAYARKVQP